VRFRQGDGRDGARRAPGEVVLRLRRRADELERLWDADRLVRGDERADVRIVAPHHLHDGRVLAHAEAEAAVLLGDLDPEGAEPSEAVHHLFGVLAGLVDGHRVDLLTQEPLHVVVELLELRPLSSQHGEGVDVIEEEVPEEELAEEGPPRPLLLPGFLRYLPRLLLAREPCVGCAQDGPSLSGLGSLPAAARQAPAYHWWPGRRYRGRRGLPPPRRRGPSPRARRNGGHASGPAPAWWQEEADREHALSAALGLEGAQGPGLIPPIPPPTMATLIVLLPRAPRARAGRGTRCDARRPLYRWASAGLVW